MHLVHSYSILDNIEQFLVRERKSQIKAMHTQEEFHIPGKNNSNEDLSAMRWQSSCTIGSVYLFKQSIKHFFFKIQNTVKQK